MGYDLHITRRELWFQDGDDITIEEFEGCVRADSEFTYPSMMGANYADWKSAKTGAASWICWEDGRIDTKNPNPELIDKMVKFAEQLRAVVQGDDGEKYGPASPEAAGESVTASAAMDSGTVRGDLKWPVWKVVLCGVFGAVLSLSLKFFLSR